MINLLKELCLINGISGNETLVREYIISRIKDYCEYRTDNLGNLICFCKGKSDSGKKLMICAHMDEVGFIVTHINDDGTLNFAEVGGIDTGVMLGRQVKIGDIYGVIGSKAVHNLTKAEREKLPETSSMYIDIGADTREQAEKYIKLGDSVCFESEFTELGNCIKAKAIDDRAGCAIMVKMIQETPEYDTYFVFNTREEIGLRGAGASTSAVNPDFAIVLESTTAGDIDGVIGNKKVCELGKGAVVGFMDRRTVYDKELYKLAFATAKECDILCQTKTMIAGGNDSGVIHTTGTGVRTIAISLPCRYLHSPSCVINRADLESTYVLAKQFAKRVHEL